MVAQSRPLQDKILSYLTDVFESLFVRNVAQVNGSNAAKQGYPPDAEMPLNHEKEVGPRLFNLRQALDILDNEREAFKENVGRAVGSRICSTTRSDCMKILQRTDISGLTKTTLRHLKWAREITKSQAGSSHPLMPETVQVRHGYQCQVQHDCSSSARSWAERFIVIANYMGPSLPRYEGYVLDFGLSEPIIEEVEDAWKRLFSENIDLLSGTMIEILLGNKSMWKRFVKHLASAIDDSREPLTEEVYNALVHFLQHKVSPQMGANMAHESKYNASVNIITAAGTTVASVISKALLQSLETALSKSVARYVDDTRVKAILSDDTRTSIVRGAMYSTVRASTAALGISVAAIKEMPLCVIVPIVGAFGPLEVLKFQADLAAMIVPNVASTACSAKIYREANKTALQQMFYVTVERRLRMLAAAVVKESDLAEQVMESAKMHLMECKNQGLSLSVATADGNRSRRDRDDGCASM